VGGSINGLKGRVVVGPSADRLYMTKVWLTMVGRSMKTATKSNSSYAPDKRQLLLRLRRMEGQVRGIAGMIDEERYCMDVIQQLSSLRAAADGVTLKLLRSHLDGCVRRAVEGGDGAAEIDEVMELVRRYTRS
jgi:DNA-binding FrmR family transcriptional regulator